MRWSCCCPWHFWAHLKPQCRLALDSTQLWRFRMFRWAPQHPWNSWMTSAHSNKHCDITPGQGLALAILIVFLVFFALLTCVLVMRLTCSQSFVFAFSGSLLSHQVMDRLSSSASTATSIDDYSEHNMWNPLLELLFLKHVNGIVDSYVVDFDLARIAFSCQIVLDLLCYKEEVFVSPRWYIGHHCPWNF